MLRFLRARKGDVGRGLAMMATMLRWRLDSDVEALVEKGDLVNSAEIPKFIEQQKSGKVFSLGCTGEEEPICYVLMKYHSIWGQPSESMQKFIVTQMETFRLLMGPPVDKACIFFDLKGFGIKQMDIVSLLYLVKVLESYYPESLAKMYVSNAPYVFWGFWRVVKNLLDPVVRNKIVFIEGPKDTGDYAPEDRIIKYCGGKVQSEFKYVESKPGENDCQKDEETKERLKARHHRITDQFEKVTREWCAGGGEEEDLNEKRQVLIKKLRLSQFELEPYTRGLTVYHRNGVLPAEHQGIATFDYALPDETVRQVIGKATCRKSIERELCEIEAGASTKQAEEKTQEMLKDGSWGDWRVNDNSAEIKEKAVASLDNLDGKSHPAAASDSPTTPTKRTKKEPEKTSNGKEAAAAAGVAAGGGAAAAAAVTASNGTGAAPERKPSKKSNASATPAPVSKPEPKQKVTRNSSIVKNSSTKTGTTDYAAERTTTPSRKSILGSIRSKLVS
jgi:hypothetical protein